MAKPCERFYKIKVPIQQLAAENSWVGIIINGTLSYMDYKNRCVWQSVSNNYIKKYKSNENVQKPVDLF